MSCNPVFFTLDSKNLIWNPLYEKLGQKSLKFSMKKYEHSSLDTSKLLAIIFSSTVSEMDGGKNAIFGSGKKG